MNLAAMRKSQVLRIPWDPNGQFLETKDFDGPKLLRI